MERIRYPGPSLTVTRKAKAFRQLVPVGCSMSEGDRTSSLARDVGNGPAATGLPAAAQG